MTLAFPVTRSDVALSTVCEVNEKVLPAITLPARTLPVDDDADKGVRTPLQRESDDEVQSPELDVCVLQPLDFDASTGLIDGQQCLALHHRRRFGRQRGSISLDGNHSILRDIFSGLIVDFNRVGSNHVALERAPHSNHTRRVASPAT